MTSTILWVARPRPQKARKDTKKWKRRTRPSTVGGFLSGEPIRARPIGPLEAAGVEDRGKGAALLRSPFSLVGCLAKWKTPIIWGEGYFEAAVATGGRLSNRPPMHRRFQLHPLSFPSEHQKKCGGRPPGLPAPWQTGRSASTFFLSLSGELPRPIGQQGAVSWGVSWIGLSPSRRGKPPGG